MPELRSLHAELARARRILDRVLGLGRPPRRPSRRTEAEVAEDEDQHFMREALAEAEYRIRRDAGGLVVEVGRRTRARPGPA